MVNTRSCLMACATLVLALPASAQATVTGTWRGEAFYPPMQKQIAFSILLHQDGDGRVIGGMDLAITESPVTGSFDAESGVLKLQSTGDSPGLARIDLELVDDVLEGSVASIPISAERSDTAAPVLPRHWIPIEPPTEYPVTIDLDGLPNDVAEEFDRRILARMRQHNLVGLSAATVIDGQLVDVRSYGWQDAAASIPATGVSTYRWASISKPMTAIAALQLMEQGKLDLDADVRSYVPEFPEKPQVITSRQLLCHQGGIVHYSNGPVIRTVREYDVPHPFEDRILALDMFKQSPLVCEPGTKHSYSTPGYVLLGAVVERAGAQKFRDQVLERIAEPLGMSSLQPDHEWLEIANRTPGYRRTTLGQLYESSGSDKVSWKLAAGGWTSTVADLARFGAAVARGDLLDKATWELALTPQPTADGKPTSAGFGFGVLELAGRHMAAHSGGQQKTTTYLIIDLQARAAVALMCNTRGAPVVPLGQSLIQWLVE